MRRRINHDTHVGRMGARIKLEEKIVIFMAEYAAYRIIVWKSGRMARLRVRDVEKKKKEQQSGPLSLVRSSCGRYVRRTGWKSSAR